MESHRRRFLRVLAGVGVDGLAGCSGGDGTTDSGTTTGTDTTETTTTAAETTTTAAQPTEDWLTFQYDNQNTGYNPTASGPTETPSLEWETEDRHEAHPIIVEDTLYIGGKSSVAALDVETGDEQWTYEVGDTVRSAPAYADGTVVFNGWDGSIYAVSADDGSEKWVRTKSKVAKGDFDSFEFNAFLETGAVKIEDGTVYNAGLVDRRDAFWALDLETGETEFAIDSTPDDDDNPWHTSDEAPRTVTFQSAPAIDDGMAYLVEETGWVYAIDLDAGSIAWSSDPSDGGGGHSSVAVEDGTVYFANSGHASSGEAIYALDASTANLEWTYTIGEKGTGNAIEATPTVAHGAVFIGDDKNVLHAVETEDGTERWTFDAGSRIWSAATADPQHVYVGTFSPATLYAIDPDSGEEVWSVSGGEKGIGRDIDTPPVVHDETMYVNSELGPLAALR